MATGDLASRNNNPLADIQALLTTFKGTPATTTSSTTKEDVSAEKANAYIKQIMESTQGLSAVSSGQKAAGMYGSTTNQLLTNDLLARTAAGAAALSTSKTTTQTSKQAPALSLAGTLGTAALGAGANALLTPAIKAGAKKLGVDKWGQELSDTLWGGSGGASAGSFDISSEVFPAAFDKVGVDSGALGDMSFMDSVSSGADTGSGSGGGVSGAEAAALGIGGAAVGSALAGTGAAAATGGGYAIAAGATEFATTAAAATEGAGIFETVATIAAALWIVCTELRKQGRMNPVHYVYGARKFATYDDEIKRGYYVWAIPSTKHLRENPHSAYSKFLEVLFCNRAEYLAAEAGCTTARKTFAGAVATYGTHAFCWLLSRTIARKPYTLNQIKGVSNV